MVFCMFSARLSFFEGAGGPLASHQEGDLRV